MNDEDLDNNISPIKFLNKKTNTNHFIFDCFTFEQKNGKRRNIFSLQYPIPMYIISLNSYVSTYTTAFILLCTWGKRWCAPPVIMYMVMLDDSIYVGPPPCWKP